MAEFSTIARPYAEALYKVAQQNESNFDTWHALLMQVCSAIQQKEIADFLHSPASAKSSKVEIFSNWLGQLQSPVEIVNFMTLLVENDRLVLLEEIIKQFHDLCNAHRKSAEAIITSAFALNEQELKDITVSLEKKFGVKIFSKVKVDPDVIGGVHIQIGDQVIDSTVRAQLTNLYRNMVA